MTDDIMLLDSEDEAELRSTLRRLLATRCSPPEVAAAYEGDRSLTATLWKSITSELGLAGLLVPEDRGGVGASAREAGVVLEELGRAVTPVPFLTSSVVATIVALAGDGALVEALATGAHTAALLVPFTRSSTQPGTGLALDGDRVTGSVTSVAGVLDADVILVPVMTRDGLAVYAVAAAHATVAPVVSLDMTRPLADVTVDGVGRLVVPAERGEEAVRAGLAAGEALLPSEQAGLAAWCLETTVAYLKERRQFGRVVGGFQSLKHRLADLFVEVESATVAARYAAGCLASGDPDAPVASAMAMALCGEVAVHAAEEAIQLHGGIGMTWEYPLHLYLKRAKADQLGLGLPAAHRDRLADLVDLAP